MTSIFRNGLRLFRGGQRKIRPIKVCERRPAPFRFDRLPSVLKTIEPTVDYDTPKHVEASTDSQSSKVDTAKSLKVVLLNAWSVCNKTSIINYYIVDNDIDVAIITETWLKKGDNAIINELVPDGYLHKKENRSSRGGGVMLIHKSGLKFKKRTCELPPSFELLECQLNYENSDLKFIILYKTPKSSTREFLNDFYPFLLDKSLMSKNTYIFGDFNIHVNDVDDPIAREFLEILNDCNMTQRVVGPTHRDGNTLDLAITHEHDSILQGVKVVNNHISDHYSVEMSFILNKPERIRKTIKYRNLKSIDMAQFNEDLRKTEVIKHVEEAISVEDKMEKFNSALTSVLDEHAPIRTRVTVLRPNTQWFNEEIRASKKRRRVAERKWRRTGAPADKALYTTARNETNRLITESRRKYMMDKIAQNKSDTRRLFKIVNELISPDTSTIPLPEHSDDMELANRFNNFFTQKINDIRNGLRNSTANKALPTAEKPPISIQPENGNPNYATDPPFLPSTNDRDQTVKPMEGCTIMPLAEFAPATVGEISKLITNAPNKSCSLDAVPTSIIKACIGTTAPCIASIVNRSITNADFPQILKEAHVTPLLKGSNLDHEELKNYRPVSNLNFISKVIEKLVVGRLSHHITFNSLAEQRQSAYKTGHSTETALLRVHSDIIQHLKTSENVALVLLDLSAAFDTVDHDRLLGIMHDVFKVSNAALEWFREYLTSRIQRVNINGSLSTQNNVNFGVPQGSVLGPFLFTMYIIELGSVIRKNGLSFQIYADDTQLYTPISSETMEETVTKIEQCARDVKTWMTSNMLKLNDSKTEFLVLRKIRSDTLVNSININDHIIHRSTSVRNLGFVIDECLSMQDHVTKLCQITNYHLRNIYRIRNILDADTLRLLVHALVTSRLDYCNSLLYGAAKKVLNRLQVIQNKAARIISKSHSTEHITPVLKSLHWLPIEKRITFKIACFAFKCLEKTAPNYLQELLQINNPARDLRSSGAIRLYQSVTKSKFVDRSFVVAAPTIWNSLSPATRNSKTYQTFKKKLKFELFNAYYRS